MKKHIAGILIMMCGVIGVASSQGDNEYNNGRGILGYNADMMRQGDAMVMASSHCYIWE